MNARSRTAPLTVVAITLLTLAACDSGGRDGDTSGAVTSGTTAAAAQAVERNLDELDDQVERALRADAELAPFRLDADDERERLVIEGAVSTDAQKARAAQIAAGAAPGVTIDNQIRVDANATRSGAPDADDAEDLVEDAIEADATLRAFDLDVDDENGRLVLKGTVRTAAERTQAEEIAKRAATGIGIDNRIRVQ